MARKLATEVIRYDTFHLLRTAHMKNLVYKKSQMVAQLIGCNFDATVPMKNDGIMPHTAIRTCLREGDDHFEQLLLVLASKEPVRQYIVNWLFWHSLCISVRKKNLMFTYCPSVCCIFQQSSTEKIFTKFGMNINASGSHPKLIPFNILQ
jgi:hypothetical protein